jgi:hypothetical protein
MVWKKAWAAAWARARSWTALAVIVIGITSLYVVVPNELRIRLTWQIPLSLTILLLVIYVPIAAYQSYRELEEQTSEVLLGKWFHTVTENGTINYQGKVLRQEGGRYFIQLYDFVMGEPTTQRYLTQKEAESAQFYDSNEAMRHEYDRLNPPRH